VNQRFDICVVGLGYIGLPTASIFATKGKRVLGVDVVPTVVETINDGRIHIEEPDLDILVRAAVQSGNLTASPKPAPAGTFIIAVPTPFRSVGDALIPDLTFVESATKSLAPVLSKGDLIILESTSPVGTTEKMRDWLLEELGTDFDSNNFLFAHCPERILPGQMLKELVTNDRIAGGLTPEASQRAKELYETFCTAEIFVTDARTAELAKLTENSYRDVNIAFANEMSMICDSLGIDVWELIRLANRHPRVNILQPGPGVGGHCIAVDPWFIVSACPEHARLIRTSREVNDAKPQHVVAQVQKRAERFRKPVIACLGVAFKADVDDLRESPALAITQQLAECFPGDVIVCEPHISQLPARLDGLATLEPAEEAIKRADIVVLLVDHRPFKRLSRRVLDQRVVIDTRGCWA
jgi:UDP-N-acetyl-D-mannosaminuronic acid dehydrogenase